MNRKFVRHAVQSSHPQDKARIIDGLSALAYAASVAARVQENQHYKKELRKVVAEAENLCRCVQDSED